jgi:hypothetical protein
MIALCRRHHDAADGGAYTIDDFREMKARGRDRSEALSGRFDWRRHRLLAVVGGRFYYETPIPLELNGHPVIWFHRDEQKRLLLNVAMPSAVVEPRLHIDDNFWMEAGEPASVECPPQGRKVSIAYPNGDSIRVEFFEIEDGAALSKRYTYADQARHFLENEEPEGFPVTAVEIQMRLIDRTGDPVIDFDAQETRIGGWTIRDSLSVRSHVGVSLNL